MRQSRCSVFYALLGADVVVALLKLSAFRVLLLWVSGGEFPSVDPVSRAVGVVHRVLVLECFGFVLSGAWVHCVVPWVAPGAGDSTMCCCRVPGHEICVSSHDFARVATLVVVPLPLWGGCFALSR
ncbi:hypothetical protein Taro_043746 [Colocasia esculenta]|uniref:Uncharacterized protein n=1 Tax=Colocasia esculenta TaxID=4460 RepID=A0A843X1A3_COLES|nr:hypothetical protein [Colocasia esculenta]